MQMCTVLQQDVSGKDGERVALCNFATDDASPDAIFVECGRIAELELGLGLGFSGSRGSTRTSIFWEARHMCSDWISIVITRHGPMRADTSIGRDSGSRRTHEQN